MADKLIWISADGVEYPISDNHLIIDGSDGKFMPPISFVEDEVPFQPGSKLRGIKVAPREVDIAIYADGSSAVDLRSQMRTLMRVLNPLKGDGRLRVIAADGVQRDLVCRYKGGVDISEKKAAKIGNLQAVVLVFRAFDPFWYDTTTKVHTFDPGTTATFFPFFPLRLSSSSVFADFTINNEGDVETWPEWYIEGPGENLTIRNLTTGRVLRLETYLQEGESITIDTQPNKKIIVKSDGTNLFATQTDDSSLWSLQDGINNIRIEMGGTLAQSKVHLNYKNRYWSP